MFLDELQPIIKELLEQPVAFAGGFFSGILRLKLTDEPLRDWLEKQGMTDYGNNNGSNNGNSPQSITIE